MESVVTSGCSISAILVIEMARIVVPSAMAWPHGNDDRGGIGNTSSTKGFGRGGEGHGKSVATGEKVCGAGEQCSYPYAAHPYDVDHDVSSTVSSDGADADLDMSCTSDSPVFFQCPSRPRTSTFSRVWIADTMFLQTSAPMRSAQAANLSSARSACLLPVQAVRPQQQHQHPIFRLCSRSMLRQC